MASGFQEIYDHEGYVSKVSGNFGKSKEICMNAFNGRTYVHVSDKSKCFVNGKFDISKSKSITITYEEALQLKHLIDQGKCYDTAFHHYGQPSNVQQYKHQTTETACASNAMQGGFKTPGQPPNAQQYNQKRAGTSFPLDGMQGEFKIPSLTATPLRTNASTSASEPWDANLEYWEVPEVQMY